MTTSTNEKFRNAVKQQISQLGREIETLSTENSQLRAEIDRLRQLTATTNPPSNNKKAKTLLGELLIAGDLTIPSTPLKTIHLSSSNPLCVEAHSSTSNNYVCIGYADKYVTLIDWTTEESIIGRVVTSAPVLSVRFLPNYTQLVLASGMNGSCHLIDFKLNQVVLNWRDHDSYVLDTRISPYTSKNIVQCVTVSRDKSCVISTLKQIDTTTSTDDSNNDTEKISPIQQKKTWKRTKLRSFFFENVVESAVFVSPTLMRCTEDLIIAERNNNNLIYCNIKKNTKRLCNMNEKNDDHVSFNVLRLEVSPSGRFVLVATDSHRIFIMGNGGDILRNFYGHTSNEMSTPRISWHTSEKYIMSNSQKDCSCHVWNIASERTEIKLNSHDRAIRDISVADNYLFTVSYDKLLNVWSIGGDGNNGKEGKNNALIEGQGGEVKISNEPTIVPSTTGSDDTITIDFCDKQLIILKEELESISKKVQAMNGDDENRISLKKKSRNLRKQIKKWKHDKKQINRIEKVTVITKNQKNMSEDPYITEVIHDSKHPDIQVYANIKDANDPSRIGKFIVEGKEPIRLLLESDLKIHSLYLKPTIYNTLKLDIIKRYNKDDLLNIKRFAIYISKPSLMANVAGYLTARGSFACGLRPVERNEEWLYTNILKDKNDQWKESFRILAIDGCNNTANLGSLIRSGTALGMNAIIISNDCCDPWYRQCIRVSMGHIFHTPIIKVNSLTNTLIHLQSECNMLTWGAVIDQNVHRLMQLKDITKRWCGIVGNEDKGISNDVRNACLRENGQYGGLCRIDMASNVDSLSITVAAGIFLNGLCEREVK